MNNHNQPACLGKSIAVLPFVNMSADADNEYFSDGITEEVINALTTIQCLKVIARTSSFSFKGKNIDVRNIGRQLGVKAVLEGSVRKVKNRVRITAQLIRTDDGTHLWSKNFDRELEDIFALQDEISLLIAERIRENFGHLEIGKSLVNIPNVSVEIYQLYLKGRHSLHKFNRDDIRHGILMLEQVVQQKPDFALAHVSIHYGYNMMAAAGLMPVEEALSIGKSHLDRAMALDDQLPECYHSLGWHSLNQDWDFSSATRHLMKAIELRPGHADAHQKLFINLALEGRLDTAFEHINAALQLDPLASLNNYFTGYYFYLKEDFENSNHYLERTFELEPSFIVGYSIYGLSLCLQNRPGYLLEKAKSIPDMEGAETERLIMQTLAYSQMGDMGTANKGMEQLKEALEGVSRERVRFFLVYIETILGNYESALDFIEKGVANREPLMTLIKVDPLLRPLHKFERFQTQLREIYALSDLSIPRKKDIPYSTIDPIEVERYLRKIGETMEDEQVFLDPSLSLRSLAEQLEIHPNKLSWLLNDQIGKNFNEYINSFRLKAFKSMAMDSANDHLNLLDLAFESGFNSKTVFNAFFKKMEGMTPKAWIKSMQ